MKKTIAKSSSCLLRLLLFYLLLMPWLLSAQTATHITSDSQVGCRVSFTDKDQNGGHPTDGPYHEYIQTSECIRVCSGSNVKYTVHGQNISNVRWTPTGGTINSTSGVGNSEVKIHWSEQTGNGSLQAVITYSNGTIETQNLCIERVSSPVASFNLMNLEDTVCLGSPIQFINTSHNNGGTDIVSYYWEFGDLDNTTSTAMSPSFSYSEAGIYIIRLTVTNQCGCSSTFEHKIEVIKSPPILISCASVVCEGSTEVYSVDDGCSKGEWKVIGGRIITNHGNNITVKWDSVDPLEGFGYVMYRSECGCKEWNTIKIPVILSEAKINGPSEICVNQQYKYSLPQWPTTDVNWSFSGAYGNLDYNQQRNEVLFTAYQPGVYELFSDYENTLLGCSGKTKLTIRVGEPLTILNGVNEICKGSTQSFTTTNSTPAIWKVYSGNNIVYRSSIPEITLDYRFDIPGNYWVTAEKENEGCESKARLIKVVAPPTAPSGPIDGERLVCTEKPYVYTLVNPNPEMIPMWEVIGGTIQGSNTGNSITVIFNEGASSYGVSVSYATSGIAGCLSTPLAIRVTPINLNSITINSNQTGPYCPSSTRQFSANLNGIVPDHMEWYFQDANFGSIISGQGTENITVNFNEISTRPTSKLALKIVKCGKAEIILFDITLEQTPTINFVDTGAICLGNTLTFRINNGSVTNANDVIFTFENGTSISRPFNNTNGIGSYSFNNNEYIQNNNGSNVIQRVVVNYVGTNICNTTARASFDFIVYPRTTIRISPMSDVMVCDRSTMSNHTLIANSSTGLTQTTNWQWLLNGTPILGANTNSYTLTRNSAFGRYSVRATDRNGCVVESNRIRFSQLDCGSSNECNLDPQISFTPVWSDCNKITMTNVSFVGTPDEILWNFNQEATSNLLNPTFTPTKASRYLVILSLKYGDCWYREAVTIDKNYEPKFSIATVCTGSGYNVTLHNTSTIFNIENNPITYTFSGNNGVPMQTGETAIYNNLAPGTYSFEMKIQAQGLPDCIINQSITLPALPNLDISVPSVLCVGEVITLNVPGTYSPNNIYTWKFDGTSYVTTQPTAQITFNTAGQKTIVLMIETPEGCTYQSLPRVIRVFSNNGSGNLSANPTLSCVGSSSAISYSHSLTTTQPQSYIWMNGNVPVPNNVSSSTYTATESGNYWPILVSANGCKSYEMSRYAIPVIFRNAPFVNISAQANICAGQSTTLTGIVTETGLEYRWLKNGTVVRNWATGPYPITLNTGSLTVGTYTYKLEVRPAGMLNACTTSKEFTITVSTPPTRPTVSYTMISCQPYKVRLTATGPSNGQYNWSNGMVGQSITVHEGGTYEVTYTAPTGCKVTSERLVVPLSIESLLWVFPTGCYNECFKNDEGKIIGPRGIFNSHAWQYFGNDVQTGTNGPIDSFGVSKPGNYQLQITQGQCTVTSGNMYYYADCDIDTECQLDPMVKYIIPVDDYFIVEGYIKNNGSHAVSVKLSSSNGTYIPSVITIPAGGLYDMPNNPLAFYPNASYQGGAAQMKLEVTPGTDCEYNVRVENLNVINRNSNLQELKVTETTPSLTLVPNPVKEKVEISYVTSNVQEKAKKIAIYDATGNVKFTQELTSSSGKLEINVSDWLQGVYIVIINTDGKPLQAKLLKK